MPLDPRNVTIAALFGTLALALPVSLAMSKTEPAMTMPADPHAEHGRPMDDLGGADSFGDLSVFDAITEIGVAQSPDVPYCDRRAALLATLDHDFAESPRMRSPLDGHRSVELWASEVMGTWTAVYTRADGVACVVSSGIGWQAGDSPVAVLESEGLLPTG